DFTYGLRPLQQSPDGTTYNLTGGQAFFTYPYMANLGRHVHVSARLAADPAGGQPISGTLVVNGAPATRFRAAGDFTLVQATLDTRKIPNPYLDPAHVQIEIRSETRPDAEGNEVGVAIDWVRLESERSRGDIVLEAVLWAAVLALFTVPASIRLGSRRGAFAACALLATMVAVRITYLPRAIPPWVEIILVGVAWALAVLLAPRMGRLWVWALPLVGGLLWLMLAGRVLGDWQMDDAYISYRYAWNLAHGQGLVYNPGEIVEGYTNFLWTLISAGAIALGIHPAGPMLAINIALAMGVVALSWRLAPRLTGSYLWANVAVLLLCVDGALAAYGARGSGMEAMLFGFCTLLALSFLWNDGARHVLLWRVLGGSSLALGVLTRPEGWLVAGVLLAVRGWQDRAQIMGAARWAASWIKPSLASLLAFAAIVVPYEAWRILFYGWLLPNTFYAKTGATLSLVERGLIYTGYFVTERWFVIVMAIIGGILLLGSRKTLRNSVVPAMAALIIPYTAYVLWAGGDYFPGWRFYVPVLAPIVLVAVWAADRIVSKLPGRSAVTAVALAIMTSLVSLYSWQALWQKELAQYTKIHLSYVNLWGSAGLWLRDATPPDSVTAAQGAGAIAYYSQRKVVDMYGLNDLHIGHLSVENMGEGKAGHEKRDPAYVLNVHKPDYIYALWADYFDPLGDQFAQQYEEALERSPTGTKIEWLRRRDQGSGD
ncbi:MAG: hypothetical protein WCD37_13805, partial [Chloroflexia bacterium]